MLKNIKWELIVGLSVAVIFLSGFVFMDQISADQSDDEQNTEKEKTEDKAEINPFGDSMKQKNIDDAHIIKYIHAMSHQKVEADKKWGFYEITDKRINWLLDAVDHNKPLLNNTDKYTEILTRWKNDDFSQIDDDHNFVWNLQGGTKGAEKATGILSDEEEKAYINNTPEIPER